MLFIEFLVQVEGQIKTPFILLLAKDEERNIQLSWYHLHLSVPHDTNLVEYSYPYSFRNAAIAATLRVI